MPFPAFTEAEIQRLLDPAAVIAAIESAFRDRYPAITVPTRMQIGVAGGIFLLMPCYDRSGHVLGMKLVTVLEHPSRPDDRIHATYLLLDPQTAQPKLTIPANYLTDLRTAATSAVATKFLAREDASTLGVYGAGRQAGAHLRVLPRVRRFQRALVCGRDFSSSAVFAKKMSAELGLPVEAVDAATCASQSDVICTCTTSQVPLFDGRLIRPGTHLNLVGVFQPHAREVDSTTVRRALVVVDTYDAAFAEAGDLLFPIAEGTIPRTHIAMDLHELLTGKLHTRREITLFKSVGCALEDLVTAELLLTLATSKSV